MYLVYLVLQDDSTFDAILGTKISPSPSRSRHSVAEARIISCTLTSNVLGIIHNRVEAMKSPKLHLHQHHATQAMTKTLLYTHWKPADAAPELETYHHVNTVKDMHNTHNPAIILPIFGP